MAHAILAPGQRISLWLNSSEISSECSIEQRVSVRRIGNQKGMLNTPLREQNWVPERRSQKRRLSCQAGHLHHFDFTAAERLGIARRDNVLGALGDFVAKDLGTRPKLGIRRQYVAQLDNRFALSG